MRAGRTRKVAAPDSASISDFQSKQRASITVLRGPSAGHEVELTKRRMVIGRSAAAALRLDEDSVSQEHAAIEFDSHGFGIRDLGSTNGVKVNGAKVDATALKHGDRIALGACELQYVVEKLSENARTWVVDDT